MNTKEQPLSKIEDHVKEMCIGIQFYTKGSREETESMFRKHMEEYSLSQLSELKKEIDYDARVHESQLTNYEKIQHRLQGCIDERDARIAELEHLLVLKSTEAEVAQKLYEESKIELSNLRLPNRQGQT